MASAAPPERRRPSTAEVRRRVAEVKAALPLGETISRISGTRFQACAAGAKACCPFHEESTPSFFVNEATGRYKCFGASCGVSGDVIQFIREWHSVGFGEAMRLAREMARLPDFHDRPRASSGPGANEDAAWSTVLPSRQRTPKAARPAFEYLPPVPEGVTIPIPGQRVAVHDPVKQRLIRMVPTHVHEYRSAEGIVRCLVFRANAGDGRKFFIPANWSRDDSGWSLTRFPSEVAKPLYGLSDIPAWVAGGGCKILLVEGEKTRDAARAMFQPDQAGFLTLTTMGGGGALRQADWSPLVYALGAMGRDKRRQIEVIVWPDADSPIADRKGRPVDRQLQFANNMARSLTAACRSLSDPPTFSRVIPPVGVASGWDLADALEQGLSPAWASNYIDRNRVPIGSTAEPDGNRPTCGADQIPSPQPAQNFRLEPETDPCPAM